MNVCGSRSWQACRSLSRPLTILGCERKVFILSATFGATIFNALNSFLLGLLLFAIGYAVGWYGTQRDPHMMTVAQAAATARTRYDPAKRPASMEGVAIVTAGQEASE